MHSLIRHLTSTDWKYRINTYKDIFIETKNSKEFEGAIKSYASKIDNVKPGILKSGCLKIYLYIML